MEQVVEEFSKATKINLTPDQVRNAIQNERKREKKEASLLFNTPNQYTNHLIKTAFKTGRGADGKYIFSFSI